MGWASWAGHYWQMGRALLADWQGMTGRWAGHDLGMTGRWAGHYWQMGRALLADGLGIIGRWAGHYWQMGWAL